MFIIHARYLGLKKKKYKLEAGSKIEIFSFSYKLNTVTRADTLEELN